MKVKGEKKVSCLRDTDRALKLENDANKRRLRQAAALLQQVIDDMKRAATGLARR